MEKSLFEQMGGLIRELEIICYQISSYLNNKINQSEYGDSNTQDIWTNTIKLFI